MPSVNRRRFVEHTTRILAATAACGTLQESQATPLSTLSVGIMGVRGRGRGLATGFAGMPDVEVTYICDVDEEVLHTRSSDIQQLQGKSPKSVRDFRRILDDPGVDALVVATPDHWHALATISACQAGKDVYVEKPASHSIWEGRQMIAAARKYDRVVQHGTQSRSGAHFQSAMAFLQSGKLGEVLAAKAINHQKRADIGYLQDETIPENVDYNLWLGPAPLRPFNRNRFHYNWHWFWEYGTGDLGNDGVHQVDVARWGLGVEYPTAVSSSGGKLHFQDDQQTPDTQLACWEFNGRQLIYEMRLWTPYGEHGFSNGNIFYGENGLLILGSDGWKVIWADNQPGPSSGPSDRDDAHRRNFIDCVKQHTPQDLNAEIQEGHLSSLLCHTANISYRTGKRLRFDHSSETFIEAADANGYLKRNYRKPWVIPDSV